MKTIKIKQILLYGTITVLFAVLGACTNNDDADRIHVSVQKQPAITAIEPSMGKVGDEITITGANFDPQIVDNKVKFNGVEAVITTANETTLTAIIPEGASTGPVTVEVINFSTTSPNFTIITELVIPLTSENDDVEEVTVDFGEPVGTMDLSSSDLELGEKSSGQGLMNIGLRFNNVAIPQGATVTEVSIQFNADNIGADPVELTIYGENTGNAAAYTETLGDLSSRALTTASKVWAVPEWVNRGDRGEAQKTIDLSNIVQEIVDRADWATGNSINIIMKPTGVSLLATSSSGGREAENFSSSNPDDGAELKIVFQ